MKKSKFTGKIRTDPWDTLAYGPPEAMSSLWEEFLQEMLGGSRNSARFRVLRREIEKAGDFAQMQRAWGDLSPEERGQAWRRLVEAVRRTLEERQGSCVRCGECCEKSSPTLFFEDLPLFEQEILTWNEVYALPEGDQVLSREGKPAILQEERLKIRELPGTRQCWFYVAATKACRIYEHRPEQCRRQKCWEGFSEPASQEFLNRRHLFARLPEVWDLIAAHMERCDRRVVRQAVNDVLAGNEAAADKLFEALHFDHYLRQMLLKEWELSPAATELLLGRSLADFLNSLGLKAVLTPEGVFQLEPRKPRCQAPGQP
jgi:Fe-S-cluster containining protein